MEAINQIKPAFNAPLYIAWEVSLICNAQCVHCYSASGPTAKSTGELNTEEALNMIDDLAESGLLILAFSGGEPLLRKDIFELIERAVERNLVVNVASNGYLINERMAKKIAASGVRSVTISLDATTEALHDEFRQRKGLFKKAIEAVGFLEKEGVRVVVSFTPTLMNYHESRAVVDLAYSLGASAVNMSEYVPAGRGTQLLALPPDLLRQVIQEWIDMRKEYAGRMQIIWHDCRAALLVAEEDRDKYSGCGAGKLTARIMVDGTLTPCVFLSTPAGNLKQTPFKEMWQHSELLQSIRNRDLKGGNCSTCSYKSKCGGCRAVSMSYFGDPFMGDPSCWLYKECVTA
jgi:radical SAM protein with 4Fe4S-binding SPASM domain